MAGQTLQQKKSYKGRKNSQLQNLQGQEGGRERIWHSGQQFQGTTDDHGTTTRGGERHCTDMCGTA